MAIDKEKLREYFANKEPCDYIVTEEARRKFEESMDKLHKAQEQRDRQQREALTTCRCHTSGHCVFHTVYM